MPVLLVISRRDLVEWQVQLVKDLEDEPQGGRPASEEPADRDDADTGGGCQSRHAIQLPLDLHFDEGAPAAVNVQAIWQPAKPHADASSSVSGLATSANFSFSTSRIFSVTVSEVGFPEKNLDAVDRLMPTS